MNGKNSAGMTAGEVIRSLEDIETTIDALQRQKSFLYKIAEVNEHDLPSIRQVLHYRRELKKTGKKQAFAPTPEFLKYLRAVEGTEAEEACYSEPTSAPQEQHKPVVVPLVGNDPGDIPPFLRRAS